MKNIIFLFMVCLLYWQSPAQIPQNHAFDLAKIKNNVKSKRISSYDRSGGNNDRLENIPSGESRTLFEVQGAGVINHIWITIAPPPPDLNRNDIILKMYWDDNDEPSVVAPIGPFFGQGWNESYNYSNILLAAGPLNGRALVSYITMPFSQGARIEIENQAERKIDAFYYYVDYLELEQLPRDMGYFHAWYNHEITEALADGENEWSVLGRQRENTTGSNNYLIAQIEGKGHFIGVNYYVNCPSPMWYGEGDDMFFIDGETWPSSLHGTGTEDYFNTSWCPKSVFLHPYYGYPRVNENIGWLGRTHVYRLHVTDPVYFDKSLRFSIEHGHNNNMTVDLATVAYWYQDQPRAVPAIPDKAGRAHKPEIGVVDIHRWRHEWRKSKGNDAQLWGNE
ncbi:MAG: glycoside hydrolase family 172 protein [Candidatus Cyclobacteriaceae bacterium M3_2C_046]